MCDESRRIPDVAWNQWVSEHERGARSKPRPARKCWLSVPRRNLDQRLRRLVRDRLRADPPAAAALVAVFDMQSLTPLFGGSHAETSGVDKVGGTGMVARSREMELRGEDVGEKQRE